MDDLSGLDWSKPTGSQSKPSSTMPMNPSYPSLSVQQTPSPADSGRSTPASMGRGLTVPVAKPQPAKPSQDSFSNLMSFSSQPKSNQKLSLAERQAQLEAEKKKKEEEKRRQAEAQFGNGQQWDALGSRTYSASPSLQPPTAPPPRNDDDDLFAAFNKDTKVDASSHYPPPESHRSTPGEGKKLDLTDPSAWQEPTSAKSGGAFDDDDDPFGLQETKSSSTNGTKQPTRTPTAADDDDFLGDLGKPVEEVRMRQQHQSSGAEAGKPIEGNDDSSSSSEYVRPPPRERGRRKDTSQSKEFDRAVSQLTDYGFSPDDARRGLTESGAGINVQSAANWLLDEAHRKSKAAAKGKGGSPAQAEHTAARPAAANRTGEPDLAKTAAAVGSSFFKTANSLWRTGQKKMQQAVAEFQQEGDSSQPKWMRDAQQGRGNARESGSAPDKATNEAMALESGGRPKPARNNSRQAPEGRLGTQSSGRASPMSSGAQSRNSPAPPIMDARSRLNRMKADDDDDNFSSYVSANRTKKTSSPAASRPAEPEPDLLFNSEAPAKPAQPIPHRPARGSPSIVKQQQATPPLSRKATPKPRQVPPIASDALQASTNHRLQGTAHFKRGDYAMAHSSYSNSLTSVPATHPLMIVLLTNRALTALKTGEPKQAVTDSDEALKLIGAGNGLGESVDVHGEDGGTEQRDMRELFGKALTRKAEALEQMEKWADAGAVWQQAVEGGVGGPTAIKGRQRCQAALTPKPKAPPKPAAKPRPKPSATASLAPQKSSEAVTRLREANEAAAKEDDEKFELSEAVDQRVNTWHNGNDNLRGLLASLDTVLWENSGWKKVGMHELVMPNKVKITYMKAIAKTHPDKVRL